MLVTLRLLLPSLSLSLNWCQWTNSVRTFRPPTLQCQDGKDEVGDGGDYSEVDETDLELPSTRTPYSPRTSRPPYDGLGSELFF